MAHDYANRGRKSASATRRKPATGSPGRGSRAKPQARNFPWLVVVSLLVVCGFGFGLYKLALVESDPQAVDVRAKDNSKPAAAAPKARAVEEPAAERFHFYDLLPQSEVVPPRVEAYKSTPKTAKSYSHYLLQAGSFKNPVDADGLKARLTLEGMPNVEVQKAVSSNGAIWYRVRLGPFPSRSKLNKAQDQLVRMRLQPLVIQLEQ